MSFTEPDYKHLVVLRYTPYPFMGPQYLEGRGQTLAEAMRHCKEVATQLEWTPPAWWQLWRRKDYHEPKPAVFC